MGMGNAFVAIADDEQSLFMNPAGLAGNQKYSFHLLDTDLSISSDVVMGGVNGIRTVAGLKGTLDEIDKFVELVMGKNMVGRAQMTTVLLTPNLGIGILVSSEVAVLAQNRALPEITLGYITTNGLQAGYGGAVARPFRKKGELRLGVAGKLLYRRGSYNRLTMMELLSMNKGQLESITGSFGMGIGLDLGAQYLHKVNKRLTLSGGVAMTDIGNTSFGPKAMAIEQNLTSGVAAKYSYGHSSLTLSYDYRHMLAPVDWRKKNHLGAELAFPFLRLWGGLDQVYFTYGGSVDLWLARISLVSWKEEFGAFVHQNPARHYTLHLSMKFEL